MTAPRVLDQNDNAIGAPAGYPDDVREKIQYLRSQGASDKVPAWLEKQGYDPKEYTADPSAFDPQQNGGIVQQLQHFSGLGMRGMLGGLESAGRMPSNLVSSAMGAMASHFISPQAGQAMAGLVPGAGPNTMADNLDLGGGARLPEPQNAGERIGMKAVEGFAGAVPFAAMGSPIAALVSGALGNSASQLAAENGTGPTGQAIAGIAAGAIPGLMIGGAEALRRTLAGAAQDRQTAQQLQTIIGAATGGDAVTLGQIAQGGVGRTVEKELRQSAGGAGAFSSTVNAQNNALGRRVEDITNSLGPHSSPTVAGRAVQRGIEEGFLPRFRGQSAQLYQQAEQLVPDNTNLVPARTLALFQGQGGQNDARRVFSGLGHPFFQRWGGELADEMAASSGHGIPFGLLRDFRSRLGDIMSGRQAIEGLNQGDLKQLYGALSDDMRSTVAATGGPAATKAWDRASQYWAAGMNRVENVLQPLLDKNVPEKAFTALMSGTQDGATTLRSTLRSLTPAERRIVSATALSRLGRAAANAQDAAGEAFDPSRYLSQWSTQAPESRAALFNGINPQMTRDLNQIAQTAEILRNSGRALGGPPQVASGGMFNAILTGLGGGVAASLMAGPKVGAGLAAAAIGGKMASVGGASALAERVFTNPRMVRWLTQTTRFPAGVMGAQLVQLAKLSKQWEPDDRAVADQFIQKFSNIDWPKITVAQALSDATAVR